MFCINCGTKLEDTAKFCFSCGAATKGEDKELGIRNQKGDMPSNSEQTNFTQQNVVNSNNANLENMKMEESMMREESNLPKKKKFSNFKKRPMWQNILIIFAGLFGAFVVYGLLNGGANFTTANLKDIKTASAIDQNSFLPIGETNSFEPNSPIIYVTTTVKNSPLDTEVMAIWYYLDSNIEIGSSAAITNESTQNIQFSLSRPDNGFPIGQYEVKLHIDKKYVESAKFKVELPNSQVILNPDVKLMANSNTALINGEMVKVDPTNPNVMPVVVNGVTLIPLRFIADTYGANIDSTDRGIVIYYNDASGKQMIALFQQGSGTCLIDGQEYEHGGEVMVIDGRLMVPLRIVVEKFLNKTLTVQNGQLVIK